MAFLFSDIGMRIRGSRPYWIARAVKGALVDAYSPLNRVISLEPHERPQGRALLSFQIDPFLLDSTKPIPPEHPYNYRSSHWECTEMARSFLELGYAVDVISWRNSRFMPQENYKIFLDARHNMQRLAPLLRKECLKIFHIDAAHILFMNAAESQRLLAVQQRRGVTLRPRRFEWPNLGIEYADCATIYGNRFTQDTFRYAGKPIYRVPLSIPVLYPWSEEKDFEACRRRFLWLGSGGLVHKGLDLVLEAFAGMPDFHLMVCGPVSKEKDFEEAYKKELYELPNIHTVGWVDLGSAQFLDIMRSCVGLVYASCSEGGGGSAIVTLAAGLIPILSYEASVDVHDFGMILPAASVSEIQKVVTDLACRPAVELKTMARKAWEYARDNHSRDNFAREWRKVLGTVLNQHGAPRLSAVAASS